LNFRRVIFWVHLSLGIAAGLVGALMAGTGAIMAFADFYVDSREHSLRHVDRPVEAKPKTLASLAAIVNAGHPDKRVHRISIDRNPNNSYEFYHEDQGLDYVDPYSGEARPSTSVPLRRSLHKGVEQWHRFLGLTGDHRATGKLFASWFNVAIIPLLLTGLVLWWPARLRWPVIRAGLDPTAGGRRRGTQRGWHSALGFWAMPFLLIMVITATTHSFAWVRDTLTRMAGPTLAKPGATDSLWAPELPKRPVPVNATPLSWDELRAIADRELPGWTRLDLHGAAPADSANQTKPASLVAKAPGWGPAFFPVVVQVDPYTGVVLDIHSWAELSGGTRWLAWSRWLHKGEAFGRLGQMIAGLACLVMLLLIFTGWALAIRRFRGIWNGPR